MLGPQQLRRLLAALTDLYSEPGVEPVPFYADFEAIQWSGPFPSTLSEDEEEVIRVVVEALLEIAARVRPKAPDDIPPLSIQTAVGGSEWLMRNEIVAGRGEELPRLLPELAFFVTLPMLGQAEAMRYYHRAGELIAREGY